MLLAGLLVAITVVSSVSGQSLTVARVKSMLNETDLPDFNTCDPCIFHHALIEILDGESAHAKWRLRHILDVYGERLRTLLKSQVSVNSRHFQVHILISAIELTLMLAWR